MKPYLLARISSSEGDLELNKIADRIPELCTRMTSEVLKSPRFIICCNSIIIPYDLIYRAQGKGEYSFFIKGGETEIRQLNPIRKEWPKGDIINAIYFFKLKESLYPPYIHFPFLYYRKRQLLDILHRCSSVSSPQFLLSVANLALLLQLTLFIQNFIPQSQSSAILEW